jgi:alkylation response protein AidB-like acyl-CoA dehydrogenase
MRLADVPYCRLLEDNYEKAFSLENRYSFINANIFPILSKEEIELFTGFQEVCKKLYKDAQQMSDDIYPLFPKLGEHHMIQRMNPFDGIEGSTKHQMLLSLAEAQMSPIVDLAVIPSGVLTANSLHHNSKRSEIQEKVLQELYRGTKVGAISITEPKQGSDAVNMKMNVKINQDNSITYNGTKIYTTNGAVADYITAYGVTDISEPRRTMALTLFQRGDQGLSTERISIPAAPGVGIARVNFDNVTVPADRLVAPPGEGYKRLFQGLTPERICIIGSSMAGLWGSLVYGVIFSQIRHQFGKPIFKYQGISHKLADLYAQSAAMTAFAFNVADFYDKKVASKIHKGEKPNPLDEGSAAVMAAQGKYLLSKTVAKCAYEVVQTMGGRGAVDESGSNNGIGRGENMTRITEVVGGHRNIQLMIIEMGLRASSSMAIQSYIDKAAKSNRKMNAEILQLMVEKAQKMLATDGDKMGDVKPKLEIILTKLKEAGEMGNRIEEEAYARALPNVLNEAGKAIYKAK